MSNSEKLGCKHPKVVRRTRSGLVDAMMFRFGRYPWTCSFCGCRIYYKDRRPGDLRGQVRPEGLPLQRSSNGIGSEAN